MESSPGGQNHLCSLPCLSSQPGPHKNWGRGGACLVWRWSPRWLHTTTLLNTPLRKEEHKSTLNSGVGGHWQTLGLMISEAPLRATSLQVHRSATSKIGVRRIINARQIALPQHSWGEIHFILMSNETNPDAQPVPLPERSWNPKSLSQI